MSHPGHPPTNEHLTQPQTNRLLPPGWISEYDQIHNLTYYIDIRDSNSPHSQWSFPNLEGTRDNYKPAAGIGLSYSDDHLGYGKNLNLVKQVQSPLQFIQRQDSLPEEHNSGNWVQKAEYGIGGIAAGNHELEKQNQLPVEVVGVTQELTKEQALEAELAQVKAQNVELQIQLQQMQQAQQNQQYSSTGQAPPSSTSSSQQQQYNQSPGALIV